MSASFLNLLLGRTIAGLQGVLGADWEPNVVLRHKPTGQALTAGVSDPLAMLDAIKQTIEDPDGFVGKMNTTTGEVRNERESMQ